MADFLGLLTRFCVNGVIPRCLDTCTKMTFCFSKLSCFPATIPKFINKMRAKVLGNTAFEVK